MLKQFSKSYVDKHENFARNKSLIPPYIRLRILKHLGLFTSRIDFVIPQPVDPWYLSATRMTHAIPSSRRQVRCRFRWSRRGSTPKGVCEQSRVVAAIVPIICLNILRSTSRTRGQALGSRRSPRTSQITK